MSEKHNENRVFSGKGTMDDELQKILKALIVYIDDKVEKIRNMGVILVENIKSDTEESKLSEPSIEYLQEYCEQYSNLATIFVNINKLCIRFHSLYLFNASLKKLLKSTFNSDIDFGWKDAHGKEYSEDIFTEQYKKLSIISLRDYFTHNLENESNESNESNMSSESNTSSESNLENDDLCKVTDGESFTRADDVKVQYSVLEYDIEQVNREFEGLERLIRKISHEFMDVAEFIGTTDKLHPESMMPKITKFLGCYKILMHVHTLFEACIGRSNVIEETYQFTVDGLAEKGIKVGKIKSAKETFNELKEKAQKECDEMSFDA